MALPRASHAVVTWGQVSSAGFGSANNTELSRGTTFYDGTKVYIYFGTSNTVTGAQIWRSSTGIDWNEQANTSGFDGFGTDNAAVSWLGSFGSALFAGVTKYPVQARVYRSPTGANPWTLVFSSASMGNQFGLGTEAFALYRDRIYIGVNNANGGEIWRTSTGTGIDQWTQVSTAGFGGSGVHVRNMDVNSMLAVGNTIYVGIGSRLQVGQGQIWRSTDGVTYTQVLVATNTFGANKANTYSIFDLEYFNGYLYASASNSSGAQLWRTADPYNGSGWSQVFSSDGDSANLFTAAQHKTIQSLSLHENNLWAGTLDPLATDGGRVYRSTDGATFPRHGTPGLSGSANNRAINDFVSTGTFVYAGVRNDATGATVWRASSTLPGTPVLAGTPLGISSIAWSWAAVTFPDGYRMLDTAWVNTSGGDLSASTLGYDESGLAINTAYTRYATAFNSTGASTSTALTRYTASTSPYSSSLTMVGGSSITVSWVANSNPAGTTYQVRHYPLGSSISSAYDTTTTATSVTLTQLSGKTTYYIVVRTANGDGVYSGYDVTLSSVTGPVTQNTQPTSTTTDTFISVNTASGLATAQVPKDAFPTNTNITVSATTTALPAPTSSESSISGTNIGIEINTDTGLQPKAPVSITMQYRVSDIPGIDPTRLFIARYDVERRKWVQLVSSVDTAGLSVSAQTNHLSLFQIMASVPAPNLEQVRVFPNPWRPVTGQTSMTFVNLPADADLRVHTFRGELVRQLRANNAGMASWDGKNEYGIPVGSGVYLLRLGSNNSSRVIKVAIQR